MRTSESGVFSSCETLATNSLFSAESLRSRPAATTSSLMPAMTTSPDSPKSTISSTRRRAALAASSSAERSETLTRHL